MPRLATLALLLTVAGCESRSRAEPLGEETPQQGVRTVNFGGTFEVRVPASESTGYHWALAQPLDSTRVAVVGRRYLPGDVSGERNGVGGMDVWRFEALDTGRVEIALHHRRGKGPPAETRRYAVVIR